MSSSRTIRLVTENGPRRPGALAKDVRGGLHDPTHRRCTYLFLHQALNKKTHH